MNEHDAKTANAVLKEFDKESDTMEYTGLMKKIVWLSGWKSLFLKTMHSARLS